ncbi:MAG: hypothetical protein PVJ67_03235 [Candidatus Pacearchaeota archaeon]|jgi:DNA-binding MarR family transcriptional regulator
MDQVKEAFSKVKLDIDYLKKEINTINSNFSNMKKEILELKEIFKLNFNQKSVEEVSTEIQDSSAVSTHPSTYNRHFKPLKHQISPISIGNQGVPTDKQTNRQTDKQTKFEEKKEKNSIESAYELLNSLDSLKKEIRLKFKRLTEQEFLVFSTLYQLEEEFGSSDYRAISKKLNLTESSIRDYIARLIKKGIPIEKNKINNKNIQLNISLNLKKVVTLPTIFKLREL